MEASWLFISAFENVKPA